MNIDNSITAKRFSNFFAKSLDIWYTICYYIIVKRLSEKGVKMNEDNEMTNDQYIGILNLIIKLIEKDTPKEELIEYIKELKNNTK